MPNFAEQVVKRLEDLGVKRVYGLVGDSLNPLSDAVRQSDIEWVHVLSLIHISEPTRPY